MLFQRRADPVRHPVVQRKTQVNGLGKLIEQPSGHLGPSGYERRKTVRNLLIIKRKKKRIEESGQKYSSMFLIGYEGL
jgi:hypothetical protein